MKRMAVELLPGSLADPKSRKAILSSQLAALAGRIAVNREIAGLHFSSDTAAGKALAKATGKLVLANLGRLPRLKATLAAARQEWV
jgi:membrane-associated phospholipid phosphatase